MGQTMKQHLIDPEICIQCNTCEDTCPEKAISHDAVYVVDPNKCISTLACIPNCPTGAIDHWRIVPKDNPYSKDVQMSWSALPKENAEIIESHTGSFSGKEVTEYQPLPGIEPSRSTLSSTIPPRSAATPIVNLYDASNPLSVKVVGNLRVTEDEMDYDTHHLILDVGKGYLPLLEGQSVGIIPPGMDEQGKPFKPRLYSVSSPRDGERQGYNNFSLTVKRVTKDREGNPVKGIASNYVCDLAMGAEVHITGPYGTSFLMPNHPGSNLVMICTGTGSAPIRAMILWRYRQCQNPNFKNGKLILFFGARTPKELPFFGRLHNLPKDFIDVNLAFSRIPGQPKTYVQDLMKSKSSELAQLLSDQDTYFYVCGLKRMEEGVKDALQEISEKAGKDWNEVAQQLKEMGRFHIETY